MLFNTCQWHDVLMARLFSVRLPCESRTQNGADPWNDSSGDEYNAAVVLTISNNLPQIFHTSFIFNPSWISNHIYHKMRDEVTYPLTCNRWSLGMDTKFLPTLYWACDYLSMLGLKLIHVIKRGSWYWTCPSLNWSSRLNMTLTS